MARRNREQSEENQTEETEETQAEEAQTEAAEEETPQVDQKIEADQERMRLIATKAGKALNAAATCFDELGLEGTAKRLRTMTEDLKKQGERAVQRVLKDATKEKQEAKKSERATKREERKATKRKKDAEMINKLLARIEVLKCETKEE